MFNRYLTINQDKRLSLRDKSGFNRYGEENLPIYLEPICLGEDKVAGWQVGDFTFVDRGRRVGVVLSVDPFKTSVLS
jgi:hypothetical protein